MAAISVERKLEQRFKDTINYLLRNSSDTALVLVLLVVDLREYPEESRAKNRCPSDGQTLCEYSVVNSAGEAYRNSNVDCLKLEEDDDADDLMQAVKDDDAAELTMSAAQLNALLTKDDLSKGLSLKPSLLVKGLGKSSK